MVPISVGQPSHMLPSALVRGVPRAAKANAACYSVAQSGVIRMGALADLHWEGMIHEAS
jgi:hypothetical protein